MVPPDHHRIRIPGVITEALALAETKSISRKKGPGNRKDKVRFGKPDFKFILISAVLFLFASSAMAVSPLLTRYESTRHGFSIQIPATWQFKEGYMGTLFIAISPLDDSLDEFRENVNVTVEKLDRYISLDEYMKISVRNMARMLTLFKEEETGRRKSDAGEVGWIRYTHRQGIYHIRGLATIAIEGNQAFVVTCTAESDRFMKYRSLFELMSKSFRLTKSSL
jgi:hypothetical protein